MAAVFAYTVVVPVPIGLAIVSPIAALIGGALAICVVNLIARAVKWFFWMRHDDRIKSSHE